MDTMLTQFRNAQMKAILRPGSRVPFETFISDHMSSSEKLNSEAESIFNMMKQKDPESLALKLVDYLSRPSHKLHTRQECAKLLRKLITDDDGLCTWHNLSVSTIKSIILDCMKLEDSNYFINTLREIVSKLAASFLTDNTWPELLPTLYKWAIGSSSNRVLKESLFLVFAELADDKTMVPCIKQLFSLLLSTLSDAALDLDMKVVAVRGVFRIIRTLTEKEQFQDQLPGIMRMLTGTLTIHTEAAKQALECAEVLLRIDGENLEKRLRQLLVEFFTQFPKERTIGAILGPDLEPFQTFIFNYMSVKDPETQCMFYMMKQMHPDSLVIKLANYLSFPCHRLRTRHVCALLLKKLLTDKDDFCTWQKLSVSTQSTIKSMILDCMKVEDSNYIIKKLRKIVSNLAASFLPDNTWSELLPSLYQCVIGSSSNRILKESVFLIFAELADDKTIVPCIKQLFSLFLSTLSDAALDLDMKKAAVRGVFRIIRTLTEKEQFQDQLPGIMRMLTETLTIHTEAAKQALECAEVLLRIDDENLEKRSRQLLVEFFTEFPKERTIGAILGPDLEPFQTFIFNYMSIKDPETQCMFYMMKQMHPDSLVIKLANYLSFPCHRLRTRHVCALLLKKLLTDKDDFCTWQKLSVSTQSTIKCMILARIEQEESNFIIHKLIDIVSLLLDNTWPEILPCLYQHVINSSSSNHLKAEGFLIFGKLAEHIGETTFPCINDLHQLLLNTLNDDTLCLDVRISATRAVITFIQCVSSSNGKERFQDLLPGVMRILTEALTIHTEAAKQALECAEVLLRIDDENLEKRSRQLLVEFFTQERTIGAILGPDLEPFQTFIFNYMSVKDPETQCMFYMMKQMHPDSLVIKLANYLGRPCHHLRTRHMCALLLKKLLTDKDDFCTWQKLSVSTQSTIKCMILARIEQEESNFIIHKLIDIVSLLLDNTWPEILPCLYQHVINSSSSNHLRAEGFLIFGKLAEHIGETTFPCIKDLHQLFLNTLNDDTLCQDVRISATRAVITFIQCVSSSNGKERFQDLLPGVMRILTDTLSNSKDQEDAAHYMLDLFIKLAQNEPKFFRRQLVIVAGSMMEIAEDEKLKEGTRQRAVEFLITLVEERERTPGMMRKLPSFIDRCFTMLLNLLLDIKDDPAWHSAKTDSDNTGETSNFKIGVDRLGRFSVALGGKSIAHTAKEQLSAYLVAPEWEKRHAALVTLAHIAKGCSKLVMFKNLEQPVNMALSCLQDPHPRVRLAACRAIHNLSTVYCPDYQKQYHNQVVPALAATLDDFHPRVQASAAFALRRFCECKNPETLKPYLDELVNKLLVLIQNGKLMVQKAALRALSHLSLSVMEHFRTYYDIVMPHLKAVLRNVDLKSDHYLHKIALQCICFVGVAGGKDKFREDAAQVMEGLISLQGLHSKGDDPISANLLRAYGNICTCLGWDFLPYMSEVMPFFIIQCAQLEPVSTCLIISSYANSLKEDLYPWIPQVVSIVFRLLKFHTHDVRKTAAEAMPKLLYSAKLAVEKGIAQGGSESYLTKLSDDIILSLIEALHEEPMIEVCPFILRRLNHCLQICGPLVNKRQLHRIVDEVKHVITESSNRKRKLKERAKSEDFDAEEEELLSGEKEQEDNIFVELRRILETLIKTFKAAFLPFFDELSSYLIPMWGKENTVQERCTATHIFASLVRECPEVTLKYCDVFLPLFLDASNDEHPTVRQYALYGLALYAEYGDTVFKPFVTEAVSRINVVITHFRAREPENENVYYTAVYALGTICQFHRESIGSAQEKMRSGELLNVEPLDLEYPQLISRSFHLSNKTENHVAFRVKTMNAKKYCVRPNKGIVLPGSTCDLTVTMQARKEAPSDMQCKDRFLLQSVVANPGTTPGDFTQEMFKKEVGRVVDECRLRVIYIPPPQPPFPVAEPSRQFMKDISHLDGSEVVPIWLNCLPIKGDLVEAKYAHDLLCSMVERLDRELIGPYYQGLPKIVSVFAEVLCSEKALATEKTANRMINILGHLQQTLPPDVWESAWSYLLPRQAMELKSFLSP